MTDVVSVDECPHRSLRWSDDIRVGFSIVRCEQCGKKIEIPDATVLRGSETDIDGIIAMTFGAQWSAWREQLRRRGGY